MTLIAGIAGLIFLPAPWNVLAVVGAAAFEVVEIAFWLRFLRRYRVQTGAEGMRGEHGEALEAIGPGGGRVRVHGEIWAARASSAVPAGTRVRVVKVDGLVIEVEPEGSWAGRLPGERKRAP